MRNKNYLKRLTYTKYIYEHGTGILTNRTSISGAMAVLNFHDSLEQFLLIIADKLDIKYQDRIMKYWGEANKKQITLPYKNNMSNLCKVRGLFKHHGILPNFEECNSVRYKLLDFFIEMSEKILSIDFIKLSLADLVEDDEIKKYLKNAEKLLDQKNYEESIVESAKAFKVLERKEEEIYGILLREYPFSTLDRFSYSGNSENKKLRESFREIRDRLRNITSNLNVLLLGIDTYKYQKFKLLTPSTAVMSDGSIRVGLVRTPFRHILNYSEDNAIFCLNFVIDIALTLQTESFGLINRNKFHTIKTNNPQTKVYSYIGGAFKEIGIIDKDKIYDQAKLTFLKEKDKDYWCVFYEGNEGYIEVSDIDWIRET